MGMLVPRLEANIVKLFTVLLHKWVKQTRGQNDDLLDAAVLVVYLIPQWLESYHCWIFFVGEDNDPSLAGLIPVGLNDDLKMICRDSPIQKSGVGILVLGPGANIIQLFHSSKLQTGQTS